MDASKTENKFPIAYVQERATVSAGRLAIRVKYVAPVGVVFQRVQLTVVIIPASRDRNAQAVVVVSQLRQRTVAMVGTAAPVNAVVLVTNALAQMTLAAETANIANLKNNAALVADVYPEEPPTAVMDAPAPAT